MLRDLIIFLHKLLLKVIVKDLYKKYKNTLQQLASDPSSSFHVRENLLEHPWFPSVRCPCQKFLLLQCHLFLPPLSHATTSTHVHDMDIVDISKSQTHLVQFLLIFLHSGCICWAGRHWESWICALAPRSLSLIDLSRRPSLPTDIYLCFLITFSFSYF